MNKSFGLLFYVKKSKTNANGLVPIYLRITLDGVRMEISAKRNVDPNQWNPNRQKLNGTGEEARSVNNYLKSLEHEVYEKYRIMMDKKLPQNVNTLKNLLLGNSNGKPPKMLTPIFKEHNRQVEALIGKEYAKGTHGRYEISLKHTQDFISWKYKIADICIQDIDHEFIMAYDFYLRSVRNCNNNSTVKYLKNFKKIILICIANGWLEKDPFIKYKPKVKPVKREFLSIGELDQMAGKAIINTRTAQVRDIFLFSCYTGLAYADVKKLKRSELVTGIDGQKWIYTSRQKTETESKIPLLPQALELLRKYENHPQCVDDGLVLPVLSNQKMNSYLKEIADTCGINKELTYHIARHTFATTVTLNNGVSIESVSKMLGHRSIKTTQHYAKILDLKVSNDMQVLSSKFSS